MNPKKQERIKNRDNLFIFVFLVLIFILTSQLIGYVLIYISTDPIPLPWYDPFYSIAGMGVMVLSVFVVVGCIGGVKLLYRVKTWFSQTDS